MSDDQVLAIDSGNEPASPGFSHQPWEDPGDCDAAASDQAPEAPPEKTMKPEMVLVRKN